jgi:hypothetical protein
MDLNEKLDEHNDLINSINLKIMEQTGEKEHLNEIFGPLLKLYGPAILKGIMDIGGEDIIDKKLSKLAKKPKQYLDKIEDKIAQKVNKLTNTKSSSSDTDELIRKYKDSKQRLNNLNSDSSPYTELSKKYKSMTIRFDKPLKMEMQIDTGKKINAVFGGTDNFDIITIKETRSGDILSLWNEGMDKRTNLLLYINNYQLDRAQDVFTQLTYDVGTYNSIKKNTVITITSLK